MTNRAETRSERQSPYSVQNNPSMAELAPQRFGLSADSGELTEKISVPISRDLLRRIQDYRFGKRYSSQSDAIRHLIEAGLKELAPGPTLLRKNLT